MNNNGIARIKYFKGQMLTARDFEDQQNYHREKQKQILDRFPQGIIGGLNVTCDPKDPNNFLINEGLAVDPDGQQIVVSHDGLRVPIGDFKPEKSYLGVVYDEFDKLVGDTLCTTEPKSNRTVETVKADWTEAPNVGSTVTVARIQFKDEKEPGPTCDSFDIILEEEGGPRIRLDARVVDSDQISNGAITSEKIKIGAVTGEKIADGAVNSQILADSAVTTAKILDRNITSGKLAENAIHSANVRDGAVTAPKLANNAVNTANIVDGAVTGPKIANDAVNTRNIVDGAVTAAKLGKEVVDTINLVNGAVAAPKLANNAVNTANIVNGAVAAPKLANNAVNTGNIVDGAVTASKLAGDAVNTVNIVDQAVTSAKLADNAVVTSQIADHSVTFAKLDAIRDPLPLQTHTFNGPSDTTSLTVAQPVILQVFPISTGDSISWSFTVKRMSQTTWVYQITVEKTGGPPPVSYAIRWIAFN